MSAVVVGGVPIPVAPGSIKRDRLDGVDRRRAFDQTYRASSTGNVKRDWFFTTPPLTRDLADYYESILAVVTAQVCSGDIIGNNQLAFPNDFSNAVWGKVNATITGGITNQTGVIPAYTMTATGTTAFIQQTLPVGSSLVRENSIWARRRTGSGTVQLRSPDTGSVAALSLTANWQRFSLAGAASINRDIVIFVHTSGDAIDISEAQLEDGAVVSPWSATTSPVSCCAEITGDWTPVKTGGDYRVIGGFILHEA